jgi:hypothetical protein
MAIGPGGVAVASPDCPGLGVEDLAFVRGLEGVIDRALRGVRPGERFVYGIHQELAPQIAECVVRRYLAAGWSEAVVLPGATGAATLVLAP